MPHRCDVEGGVTRDHTLTMRPTSVHLYICSCLLCNMSGSILSAWWPNDVCPFLCFDCLILPLRNYCIFTEAHRMHPSCIPHVTGKHSSRGRGSLPAPRPPPSPHPPLLTPRLASDIGLSQREAFGQPRAFLDSRVELTVLVLSFSLCTQRLYPIKRA